MNSGKFSHFEGDDGKDKKRGKITFFCPFCLARYEFSRHDLNDEKPKCIHCDEFLSEEPSGKAEDIKCLDCLMAFKLRTGIWCLNFKGIVNQEMAEKCGDFISKEIIPQKDGDENEGDDFQNLGE